MRSILDFFLTLISVNHSPRKKDLNTTQAFQTFHNRPVAADEIKSKPLFGDSSDTFGVVVQGPIVHENNFTIETLRFLRQNHSKAVIILSTWPDQKYDPDILSALDICVLKNDFPKCSGNQNINFQIVSTLNGLKELKRVGCEYSLKLRTDQRFYNVDTLQLLSNTLKSFPIAPDTNLKARICCLGFNTFVHRFYGVSDMLFFGHTDDLITYWNSELDERTFNSQQLAGSETILAHANLRLCEVYLCTNFLTKLGWTLKWTLEDSLNAIGRFFVIIDSSMIDFYWPKYEPLKEFRRLHYLDKNDRELRFLDWVALSQGQPINPEISNYHLFPMGTHFSSNQPK